MGRGCIVKQCHNEGNHRFPANETQRAQWFEAIKRMRTTRTSSWKNLGICSSHFRLEDFSQHPGTNLYSAIRILKRGAVPSVFPWSSKQASPVQIQPAQEEPSPDESAKFDENKVNSTYTREFPIEFAEVPIEYQHHNIKTEYNDDSPPALDKDGKIEIKIEMTEDHLPDWEDCDKTESGAVTNKSVKTNSEERNSNSQKHVESVHTQTDIDMKMFERIYNYIKDDDFFEDLMSASAPSAS